MNADLINRPLIVLTGPTAVGKTDLSILLAKAVNGEIISADSIQVYKYMDIGSAKVTKDEMDNIKHYLIDEFYPDEEFNVAVFQKKAKEYIEEIYNKGKIPIIVGGTGFYIQAVLYDISFEETNADEEYRQYLLNLANTKGAVFLHDMLKKVDEKSADAIHYNNVKRVIRALEYYRQTGLPISEHNEIQRQNVSPYNFAYFVLNDDRELLYQRIDKRVDKMISLGIVEEVKGLLERGYKKELVSMQGIGYKEIIEYLSNDLTLDEAIYKIKLNTRHFAKRQLTWFRREKEVNMLNYADFNHDKKLVLKEMLKILKEKNIVI